jgi:hypothetical protein
MTVVLTALGGWAGRQFSQTPFIVNAMLLIVCFAGVVALHLYKHVRKVNLLLLAGLSFLAGLLVGQTPAWFTNSRSFEKMLIISAAIVIVSVVIELAIAYILKVRFGYLSNVLWLASLFYLVGWVGLIFFEDVFWAQTIWGLVGVVLFTILGADTIASARDETRYTDPIPVVTDLSIVYFNLWLASLVVSQHSNLLL